jgi:hypothetical protein
MFCELEERLYRSRDVFASAPAEYDEACGRHDAEMDGIRDALLAKFGAVPVLEVYRQMTIRQQKARNWSQAIWWAQRGLTLYGERAARPEAVEDLRKRLTAYQAKLAAPSSGPPPARAQPRPAPISMIEVLVCTSCGDTFEHTASRGRKPSTAPAAADRFVIRGPHQRRVTSRTCAARIPAGPDPALGHQPG